MNIHYKILSKNPEDHSIKVRYWTDKLSEEFLTAAINPDNSAVRDANGDIMFCRSDVNITIYDENATPEAVDLLIQQNAPWAWLETLEKVQDPVVNTSMDAIEVGVPKTFVFDKEKLAGIVNPPQQLPEAELDKMLQDLGIKVPD